MSKIWFCGDAHLWHRTPSSRKDDYPQTMLDKLNFVCNQPNPRKDILIFSGDFFHTPKVPEWYLKATIEVLNRTETPKYIIYGNHDIPGPSSSKRGKNDTALGIMIEAKVLHHLDMPIRFENSLITGFDYDEEITPSTNTDLFNIYVIHRFVFEEENGHISSDEVLYTSDIGELNVKVILGGHDHSIYQPTRVGRTHVIRPGALSRGTIHHFNRVRDVFIASVDLGTGSVDHHLVECRPPDEIFQEADILLDVAKSRVEDFIEMLKSQGNTGQSSLSDIINSIEMDEPIRKKVYSYLQSGSIQLES